MNKNQQKQEALKRMKLLKLYPNIIKENEKDGIVNLSENGGILYWLDSTQKAIVVSQYEEEWKDDRSDLKDGYALAYVKNMDDDTCSEFGSIGIKEQFGGLVRTA